MKGERSRQIQADRQIAATRLILAIFTIIVELARPSPQHGRILVTVGSVYALAALAMILATKRTPAPSARLRIASHVVDLAFVVILNVFTGGYASPFFSYFFFACMAAVVLFGSAGTLMTIAIVIVAYLAIGVFDALLRHIPVDLYVIAVRGGWLVIFGIFLQLIARAYENLDRERRSLAVFPRVLPVELAELMEALLRHAAAILECGRVVIMWEESEEPWLNIAVLAEGNVTVAKEPPGHYRDVLDPDLKGDTFLSPDVSADEPVVYRKRGRTLQPWSGVPLDREFCERYALRSVIGIDLTGEVTHGTLIVCDHPDATFDELILGEIVGALVASRLDQHYLVERSQETAVNAERVRLARELHDGLLQSFTGVVLQLENIHQTLSRDPEIARQRITEVQGVLMADQRELRNFILELRPRSSNRFRANFALASRLEDLRSRFVQQWGLDVEMAIGSLAALDSQPLRHEIFSIISEALANAGKHSQATRVGVSLDTSEGEVAISVSDNGRGFPFKGRYDLEKLIEEKRGPVTLKERVISLGGNMVIHSSEEGARLEIRLPAEGPNLE